MTRCIMKITILCLLTNRCSVKVLRLKTCKKKKPKKMNKQKKLKLLKVTVNQNVQKRRHTGICKQKKQIIKVTMNPNVKVHE